MNLFDELRQWHFPSEWRIAIADCDEKLQSELTSLMAALERPPAPAPAEPLPAEPAPATDDKFIAELATGLWRIRTRMVDPATDRVPEAMKRAFRHVESVWELLRSSGVEIQDHTNEPFNSGLALSAIAFQPMEGLERELVLETIRPSIYRGDRVVQMGQVIVGTPAAVAQPVN